MIINEKDILLSQEKKKVYYCIAKFEVNTGLITCFDENRKEFICAHQKIKYKINKKTKQINYFLKKNGEEIKLKYCEYQTKELVKEKSKKIKKDKEYKKLRRKLLNKFSIKGETIKIIIKNKSGKKYKINIIDAYFIGVPNNTFSYNEKKYSMSAFDIDIKYLMKEIYKNRRFYKSVMNLQDFFEYFLSSVLKRSKLYNILKKLKNLKMRKG